MGKKTKLAKEIYDLVSLLMEQVNAESQLSPEELRNSSINLAQDELNEFRLNIDKLVRDSQHLVLYKPLFNKSITDLYTRIETYYKFLTEDVDPIELGSLPIERQQMVEKQQALRSKFLKQIQTKYLKNGE